MSCRPSWPVAGPLALVAAALLSSGCSSDSVKSTCTVANRVLTAPQRTNSAGMPLLLLPDARLDSVGDTFVLLGTDGNTVRWLLLGRDGTVLGDEQSVAVPAHAAGPWFGVAGVDLPGDHVVVAYVAPDAAGAPLLGMVDLMTFSVRSDGTAPGTPASAGLIPAGAAVVMASGRGGMRAGLAWDNPGQTTVFTRLLGGDGRPWSGDLNLGAPADTVTGCLSFSAGKGDLTVGYIDLSTPTTPTFVGSEIASDGTVTNPLRLRIGQGLPGCVQVASSDTGYGVAWHSPGVGTGSLGTYFGTVDAASPGFPIFQVSSDVRMSPALVLGGLGWLGKAYAVLFDHVTGAEVWPIDAKGQKQGDLPVFPSIAGYTGTVSTQSIGSALYATYADYNSAAKTAGFRLLVKVSCP